MSTKTSRKMAKKFGPDTRVVGTDGPTMPGKKPRYGTVEGTVKRFVEGNNAQGGYAVVAWDNGRTGRHSPGSLCRVADIENNNKGEH